MSAEAVKVYAHFEAPFVPELAVVQLIDNTTQARDFIQTAVATYLTKTKREATYVDASACQLRLASGKVLAPDQLLHKVLKNKSDVFVIRAQSTPPKSETTTVKSAEKKQPTTVKSVEKKQPTTKGDNQSTVNRLLKSIKSDNTNAVVVKEELLKLLETEPDDPRILRALGLIYSNAGRFDRAITYLQRALKSEPYDVDTRYRLALAHYLQDESDPEACAQCLVPLVERSQASDDIKVLLARSLRKLGQAQHAIPFYEEVLQLKKYASDPARAIQEGHFEGMIDYGIIAVERGDVSHALTVFLRLLSRNPEHRGLGVEFTRILQDPSNISLLEEPVRVSAPSLAFIADIVKRHGALDSNLKLMESALQLQPASTSYALSLLHAYEVCGKCKEGLEIARVMLRQNGNAAVGSLTCKDVLATWENKTITTSATSSQQPSTDPYNEAELDVLACWFSIVKMLFIIGDLEPLPALIKLLDVLRKDRDLHQTAIRNEHAYFACIVDLILNSSDSLILDQNARQKLRKFHVVGDSHTLPLSWRQINVSSESFLLEPSLVTGLKCWHLRPAGDFYPKSQFFRLIKRIPNQASVLFVLGEIDCREGLLVAVNKCRYESLEEAMTSTVNIYIKVLRELQTKHQWKIYVHPVSPVLPETRSLVLQFNEILQTQVKRTPGLKWLDGVLDGLVQRTSDENGTKIDLAPAYKLDGTHLNPSYIALIEASLAKI